MLVLFFLRSYGFYLSEGEATFLSPCCMASAHRNMQVLTILREKARGSDRSQVEPNFFCNGLAPCNNGARMIKFRAEIVPTQLNGTNLLYVRDSK